MSVLQATVSLIHCGFRIVYNFQVWTGGSALLKLDILECSFEVEVSKKDMSRAHPCLETSQRKTNHGGLKV